MTLKEDGEIRYGRYLNKDSSLIKKVKIAEFSFEEICLNKPVYPDNLRSNIVHSWLHEESEIKKKIRSPDQFFDDLLDPNLRAPVIQPRDFTSDWLEEKKKAKRRSSSIFADEDEFEMALEEEEMGYDGNAESFANFEKQVIPGSSRTENGIKNEVEVEPEISSVQPEPLNSSQQSEAVKDKPNTLSEQPSPENPLKISSSKQNNTPEMSDEPLQSNVESDGGSTIKSSEEKVSLPEEDKARIIEEAQKKGFEEGFSLGEQKGFLAIKEANENLKNNLDELIKNLNGMRTKILEEAKNQFLTMTEAICETVLGKQFELHPEEFQKLIQKAVEETIKNDSYKIKVHPDVYQRLKQFYVDSSVVFLEDSSVAPTEFVVESEETSTKGSIREIVKELVEKTSSELLKHD